MKVSKLTRKFVFNGTRLQDPDLAMSPAQVKDFYAGIYPELVNAEVSGPIQSGEDLEWTFKRTTGTKGRRGARPTDAPFVVRLAREAGVAAADKSDRGAGRYNLAQELHELLNRKGTPITLPSAAIPLFL